MVKVSIIVPLYNSEKYISKCLESLVNQSLEDIEIILIDDGSTDKSAEIINSYIKKYKNIYLISRHNRGIGSARNLGIEKSKGEYICFVDSDDYVEKNYAHDMYNFVYKNKLDMAICDYYIHKNNIIEEKKIYDFGIKNLKDDDSIIYKINYSPWNKIYKKDMLIKNNITFPDKLKYEDTPFVYKALINSNKIGKLNKCLNHYIVHNNSETTIMDDRVFDILKIFDIIIASNNSELYNKSLEYMIVEKAMTYTIQQRYQKNKNIRNKFIDDVFNYLNNNFPSWKKSKYFNKHNILRNVIEKNKFITKIYCSLYVLLKIN